MSNIIKPRWKNLPLLLMLIIFALPLPLIIGVHLRWWTIPVGNPLVGLQGDGLTQDKIPLLSRTTIFSRVWQKQFSTWLNQKIPFRANLIRIHNQIYFSLFKKSYMDNSALIIGEKQYLYYMTYISPYCNFTHQIYHQEQFDQWAKRLEVINQFFLQRGQKFIFVITPSKASYIPQNFPSQIHCQGDRSAYVMAKLALKKFHVPYVDGSEITLENRSQYGDLLFSRGGMHWTLLGATLTAHELARKISLMIAHPLPELKYSYTTHFNAQGWSTDLLILANLYHPNRNYIVPEVYYKVAANSRHSKRLTLTVVGDSFLAGILDALNQAELFERMDYYFYFKEKHLYFVDGTFAKDHEEGTPLPFDPNNPRDYQNILDADVVIAEENENMIGDSAYLKMFADWLASLHGKMKV